MPKTAPTSPTAAIPATTPPMIRPVCEELPLLPLLEELLGADPDAELLRTLVGSTATALVGWSPNCPFPMVTKVPLLGIPLIVTNNIAGPGWNKFGLGGSCAVWRIIVPLDSTVYVLFSCKIRWPMFIACVVNPGRINQMVVLSAAPFAAPE